MNRRIASSFLSPSDSERIRRSFFSPPKKKLRPRRIVLFVVIGTLLGLSFFLFGRYEIIILPRQPLIETPQGIRLLDKENLASLHFLQAGTRNAQFTAQKILLPLTDGVAGFNIDLKQPADLQSHYMLLSLKNPGRPLRLAIVIRDKNYRSNSRQPLVVTIASGENEAELRIPVHFRKEDVPRLNLSKVYMMKFYFSHENTPLIGDIVIKDVVLVKKGEL